MRTLLIGLIVLAVLVAACSSVPDRQERGREGSQRKPVITRLAGDIDVAPSASVLDKGKVLISYSDCAACHKATDRKRGPAFQDIAARYPMNSTYIDILAKRIILGAKGAWGNVVMPPHPAVSEEDAKTMVMYILSSDRESE
ncbi:c-type cytochrome [Parapedobacter sp. 10938]|uniref:c-type cytochrome n=1 Tax=Parapedobacter flavus TaxID=3110225 RepID=UPI002DBF6316|nr:c-type cytochrome [Parapedobacter sp. 10938]MEC3878460.1 c-type cytochrome [Parapedobacter sp. 10938]